MLTKRDLNLLTTRGISREDYRDLRTVRANPLTRRDRGGLVQHEAKQRPKGPYKPEYLIVAIGKGLVAGESVKGICGRLGVNRKLVYRWGKRLGLGKVCRTRNERGRFSE